MVFVSAGLVVRWKLVIVLNQWYIKHHFWFHLFSWEEVQSLITGWAAAIGPLTLTKMPEMTSGILFCCGVNLQLVLVLFAVQLHPPLQTQTHSSPRLQLSVFSLSCWCWHHVRWKHNNYSVSSERSAVLNAAGEDVLCRWDDDLSEQITVIRCNELEAIKNNPDATGVINFLTLSSAGAAKLKRYRDRKEGSKTDTDKSECFNLSNHQFLWLFYFFAET